LKCIVYQLGLIEYDAATLLQRILLHQRLDEEISDILLLMEHPPTITIGRSGKLDNILASQEELSRENISLFFSDRGGDVTYHGPGQLVGYPILNLKERDRDIHKYVRDLEEVILRTLSSFCITANRDKSHAGVWVKEEQVASIGLSIRRWVTMHGFAINVKPNVQHFSFINPCGCSNRQITSMSKLLGHEVAIEAVTEQLVTHFCGLFDTHMELNIGNH
jgi:lipoate-protein ligase B